MSVVDCPFLYSEGRFCDGENHYRLSAPDSLVEPCPIYVEGTTWAKALGVEGGFTLDTFDRARDPNMFDPVSDWARNPAGAIVVCGGPGRGKTKLALGAWDYVIRHHPSTPPSKFITAHEFAALASLDASGKDEYGKMHHFVGRPVTMMTDDEKQRYIKSRPPCIVLDDLGAQRPGRETFTEYLCRMVGYRKSILITTNLPFPKLTEDYGERILSRLGDVTVVEATAGDYRTSFDHLRRGRG